MISVIRFLIGAAVMLGVVPAAQAINFNFGDQGEAVINTTITIGAGWRMQDRALDLVGKSNLDPDVCGGQFQSCQGLFRDQSFPAAQLAGAPGQFSPNFDDGNWNYDKGDPFSAVGKITQDISLVWGDYGFFMKSLFFYDAVNNDFTEYHPNIITAENVDEVGTSGLLSLPLPGITTQYGPGRPERFARRGGELLSQLRVEQHRTRPALTGAQHVTVGESATGHEDIEILQLLATTNQIGHVHIDGLEIGPLEGGSHFLLAVNTLLAQHSDSRPRIHIDIGSSDIFVKIKTQTGLQPRIGRIENRIELLLGAV
mgnify:CR=1 FL=1